MNPLHRRRHPGDPRRRRRDGPRSQLRGPGSASIASRRPRARGRRRSARGAPARRAGPERALPLSSHRVVFTPSGKRGEFAEGDEPARRRARARRRSRFGLRRARHLRALPDRGRRGRVRQARRSSRAPITSTPMERGRAALCRQARRRSAAAGGSAARRASAAISSSTCRRKARCIARSCASAPRSHPIEIDPVVRLHYVEVAEPDMHDPSSDFRRLQQALSEQWGLAETRADLAVARRPAEDAAPGRMEGHRRGAQGPRHRRALCRASPSAPTASPIDIGSTTIAAHLDDLASGEVVASVGAMNPQIRFGEDLMSRVSYVMMNPGGDKELTRDGARGHGRADRRGRAQRPASRAAKSSR